MRVWSVRIVFAGLLVVSLAARERADDLFAEDLEPAVIRVADSAGLAFRGKTTIGGTNIPALIFDDAGCPQPLLLALLSLTFEEDPAVQSARQPGYASKYFYNEQSWMEPSRVTVYIERVKYVVLAILGLTQLTPSRQVLLVESPPGCSPVADINWSRVWLRAAKSRDSPL
jgi:hypothetical protein